MKIFTIDKKKNRKNNTLCLFFTNVTLLINETECGMCEAEEPPCICSHMLQRSDTSGFMAALMC